MSDLPVRYFPGRDGVRLAYRETGRGRPLVLLHGLCTTATVQWVHSGHAALLAARGHRVILPDLRAHGDSGAPHDAAAYPPDILTDDGFALIEHLGLTDDDYDLGGYSLGGRTALRMLARGATPGRAIVAGISLDGITGPGGRGTFFRRVLTRPGTFEPGSLERRTEEFLSSIGGDPVALLHVLDTSVATPRTALARIDTPTLIVTGRDDAADASARALAEALPNGQYAMVPGSHLGAVAEPEFGTAMAAFLAGRAEV